MPTFARDVAARYPGREPSVRRGSVATLPARCPTPCSPHRRPDVQAAAGRAPRQPLPRRGHRRREGHPHPRRTAPSSSSHAQLECFVDLGPAAEGRAHVALRGGRQRRDRRGDPRRGDLQGRDARRSTSPSACASARARAAPRSRSPRATPSTSRRPSPGSRRRRSTRCYGSRSPPSAARAGSSASPRRA